MSSDKTRFDRLAKRLNGEGIPTDKPGFFDHPAFLAIERKDPSFLDEYARFVHWKQYNAAYLQRAKTIIEIASDEIHRGLLIEGRLGACIDTSMTLARILDLYGVWNYVVRGSLRIVFSAASGQEPFCFWSVDEDDRTGREYGHKWLVAPPYCVIDVTIRLQDYPRSFCDLLPEKVLANNPTLTKGYPEDILCPSAIQFIVAQGGTPKQALAYFVPKFVQSFAADFPAYLVQGPGGMQLKYVPIAIGGSDAPLQKIRSFMVQGRTAFEFYEQEIRPKLSLAGFKETLSHTEFQGSANSSTSVAPSLAVKQPSLTLPRIDEQKQSPCERAELRKRLRKKQKRKKK